MDRNRHGIPTYTTRAAPTSAQRCVWPKCPNPRSTAPALPLCGAHGLVVADAIRPLPAPDAPPERKRPAA